MFVTISGIAGGDDLSRQLSELPQLDDGRRRIVAKVPFREIAQAGEPRIMFFEKAEIRRRQGSPPHVQ